MLKRTSAASGGGTASVQVQDAGADFPSSASNHDEQSLIMREPAGGRGAFVSAPDGVQWGPINLTKNQTIVVGVLTILIFGVVLAAAVPPPSHDPYPWNYISAVIGWWYFMAWSVSFVPQIYLNWKRKSVVGQSFDYVFMNVIGFLSYSIYNTAFFAVDSVKEDYKKRFHDDNDVEANDVAFAIYAFIGVVFNTYQIVIYDRGPQKINWRLVGLLVVVGVLFAIWGVLLFMVHTDTVFNTLDWLYGLSTIKLAVTLIKYIPQVYLNWKRKCTVGWNIWNVLLDFTGGTLSVVQVFIDASTTDNWSAITGNLAKFLLGSMSMFYDTIFMVQHYCLYKDNNQALRDAEARAAAEEHGDEAPR